MGFSLTALLLTVAALAGRVEVEDATGCIDDVGLRAGLDKVIGSVMIRIDVFASVEEERDERLIHLKVDAGAHHWTKLMTVVHADCPHVPEAAALSIQRGLSAMPGFDWEKLVRDPPPIRIGVAAGGSGPVAPRVLIAARGSIGERLRGTANLRFEASPLWRVNASRIAAASAGLGVGTSWRAGFLEIRPEVGSQIGVMWILSRSPGVPPSQSKLHLTGLGGVELGGAGAWSIAFHGEFARPRFLTADTGRIVGLEPGVRAMSTVLFTPKLSRE